MSINLLNKLTDAHTQQVNRLKVDGLKAILFDITLNVIWHQKSPQEMRYIHHMIIILTVMYISFIPLLNCLNICLCYLQRLMEIRLRLFIFISGWTETNRLPPACVNRQLRHSSRIISIIRISYGLDEYKAKLLLNVYRETAFPHFTK